MSGYFALSLSGLFVLAAAPIDEVKDADEARQQIAACLARQELSGAFKPASNHVRSLASARKFLESRPEQDADEMRKKFKLEDWNPSNGEQIVGFQMATQEFLDILIEAGDIARRKAQKSTNKTAKVPSAPRSSANPLSRSPCTPAGCAAWNRSIASRASSGLGVPTDKDIEDDFRNSWSQAEIVMNRAFERLIPPLVTDGHVARYRTDGLIREWKRIDVDQAPAVRIQDCREPDRIRQVVYEIVDFYGKDRRGIIVVFRDPSGQWTLSRDNVAKGGFYELALAE